MAAMLIQFSVENYRSYKYRAVLSMEASADKDLPDNIANTGGVRLLKVAAIFGANAAGKSNIFIALTAAIMNIRLSNNMQVGQPLYNISPFLFDDDTKNKPSKFEFVFTQNGIKYVYGFSATSLEIVEEYLYAYKTARATTIFTRNENDEEVYKFTMPSIKRELAPLTVRNTKNKLFLATATEWNSKETKDAFVFFSEGINTYDPQFDVMLPQIGPMLENDADNSIKAFMRDVLKAADINIEDLQFETKEQSLEELVASIPPQLRGLVLAGINPANKNLVYSVNTIHIVDGKPYSMNIAEESEGTRNVMGISPIFKRAFEVTGEIICVDEFDKSLHPALVQYLISLFNDSSINKKNAQLIISTHTTNLLALEHLRRDQFYFVDKNQDTGESELYSLDEFSPRKRENIRNAYLLGRYGGIPNIKEAGVL
ncbi:MAG: ATP-binding protein [Lachnospiraceae bacterium]|nr:ATP-binding protein [Lachnospiraceae bacterium]